MSDGVKFVDLGSKENAIARGPRNKTAGGLGVRPLETKGNVYKCVLRHLLFTRTRTATNK